MGYVSSLEGNNINNESFIHPSRNTLWPDFNLFWEGGPQNYSALLLRSKRILPRSILGKDMALLSTGERKVFFDLFCLCEIILPETHKQGLKKGVHKNLLTWEISTIDCWLQTPPPQSFFISVAKPPILLEQTTPKGIEQHRVTPITHPVFWSKAHLPKWP